MTLAIFIPSLNRPHRLKALVNNIEAVTPLPHTTYFVISDDESEDILKHEPVTYFRDDGGTWIERNNFLLNNSTEDVIFLGSDDHNFHENWFENALPLLQGGMGVVSVNDMFNPNGTGAFVTRKYINELSGCVDTPGVIAYPGYKHNYADTELFETAKRRNKFAYCPESIVEHMHWGAHKSPKDATYEKSDAYTTQDLELYLSRQHLWA